MKLRVVIYVRISDDREGTGEGVERQLQDCLRRIERDGWLLVHIYRENDTGASDRSRKPRPEYTAMLAAARAGEFDVILAYSNSRLTRRPRELEDLVALHKETGVKICTIVSGDDDLATADGLMVARIKASVDAAEADRIGERLRGRQANNRSIGRSHVRRAWGWGHYVTDADGKRRIAERDRLNDTEGVALVSGLRKIREGASLASVARDWNRQGLATIGAKPWTATRAREVLVRWRNAGVVQHLKMPVEGVRGTWEAACTRADLDAVRAILLAPDRRSTPGRTPSMLVSGIAVCGACGRPLHGGKQRTVRKDGVNWFAVYRCSGSVSLNNDKCFLSIKRETLDAMITQRVRAQLLSGNAAGLAPTDAERARVDSLRRERTEVTDEEAQIGTLLGSRSISVVAATAALRGLAQRREDIDAEIARMTSRYALAALFGTPVATTETFDYHPAEDPEDWQTIRRTRMDMSRAVEIARGFAGLDVSQQREIVRGLFSITVKPGRDPEERVEITRR